MGVIKPEDIDPDLMGELMGIPRRRGVPEKGRGPGRQISRKSVAEEKSNRGEKPHDYRRESAKPEPRAARNVWWLFCRRAVEGIRSAVRENNLVSIFVVENSFPYFAEKIRDQLDSELDGFTVLDWNEQRTASEAASRLISLQGKGVSSFVVMCSSRTAIPSEFRSLVREDGYFSVSSPSFEILKEFAKSSHEVELSEDDSSLFADLRPQELLVIESLHRKDWETALRQLMEQRRSANALGNSRRLDEMYGIRRAMEWARQLINDIKLAKAGTIGWEEVDGGVLLCGAPGTGKTTLARAIATEAEANFIAVSPSEDWKAGGALDEAVAAVRATFARARHLAPCILFMDEIDTLGSRDDFTGANASWDIAFLNAVLTEIDGFERRSKVIVVGATNYPKKVDPALRRAGRLDRTISLELPDRAALSEMLRARLEPYPCDIGDDALRELARGMLGLSGADVEAVVRDARRRARMDGNRAITELDIQHAIYHLPTDSERRPIPPRVLERCAAHEAGHALVALKLESLRDRIGIATIAPGSEDVGGFVSALPVEGGETRHSLLDHVCLALAGRAAEETLYGGDDLSTGAGGPDEDCDLANARRYAEVYIGSCGFSQKTPNWWNPGAKGSDEPRDLVKQQYQRALNLTGEHRALLEKLKSALLENLTLTAEELRGIAAGKVGGGE